MKEARLTIILNREARITCAFTMIAPQRGLLSPCHSSQSLIQAKIRLFLTLILASANAFCQMEPPGAVASPTIAAEMALLFS